MHVPAAAVLPGDYNQNGVVDAADYVVWRMTDGTPDGYDTWRANFGATAGSGTGSVGATDGPAAVPEPAALVWCIFSVFAVGIRRVYRRPFRAVEIIVAK
jgi:hypothetical protein